MADEIKKIKIGDKEYNLALEGIAINSASKTISFVDMATIDCTNHVITFGEYSLLATDTTTKATFKFDKNENYIEPTSGINMNNNPFESSGSVTFNNTIYVDRILGGKQSNLLNLGLLDLDMNDEGVMITFLQDHGKGVYIPFTTSTSSSSSSTTSSSTTNTTL